MKKKGVELSMNVIIIAAIGLLVLIILAVLVINSAGKTQTGMKSCNALGGICKATVCNSATGETAIDGTCDTSKPYCCTIFTATGK